jgi:small conductance mechanosensitive channel
MRANIKAIKKAFDEQDITIPFPIRTLDFGIKGGLKLSQMELKNGATKEIH